MTKMMKRTSAFLMAFIMCFVLLGDSIYSTFATLYESADVIPTSKLSVTSEGAKWATGFSYTDVTGASHTIEAGDTFAMLGVNSENACCLMLGTSVSGGDTYTPNGNLKQIWESFSDDQQRYLGLAMAYGKPNYDREHYYATQLIVWEITCGFRTCNENFATTRSLLDYADLSATGVHLPSVTTIYNQIISQIKNWYKRPSGMAKDESLATQYDMTFNPATNRWECTVNVANGVLNNYNLTLSNSNYTITKKTANSFTIAAPVNCTADCKVTANKIIPAYDASITTEGLVVWYKSGKQALVTGASFDPVDAYANFNIAGTGSITLTKSFYSSNTKITASNLSTFADGATMADLYSAVRFRVTATDADGNTYYVKKASGSNGSYTFGSFTTDSVLFAVNSSTGILTISGLPQGFTYTITETQTYSSDSVSFRLAGEKTITLDGNKSLYVNNYLVPKIQTTQFYIEKNVLQGDGAEYTDSTFLEDYYNNVSFYLYTLDDSGNKQYLVLGNVAYSRYAGYIKQDTTTNTTHYNTDYTTTNRSNATEIKVASEGTTDILQGIAYFYNIPQFANGLYLEEIISEKYIDGFYATNTYNVSTDGAVFEIAKAGDYLSSFYEIDNQQKTFRAAAYKVDVNYTPDYNEAPMSQYLNGGEFGLYNSANELLSTGTCVSGVIVFDTLTYDVDETYYIAEITAPEGYVLDTTKHYLTFNNSPYNAIVGVVSQNITNKAVYGNINIEKTDSTTGTALEGATFGIVATEDIYIGGEVAFSAGDNVKVMSLDANGAFVIGTEDYVVTTNAEGKASFNYLPLGNYEVVETDVPDGYTLNESTVMVSVSAEVDASTVGYTNTTLPIQNTLQGGVLHVYKTDGTTETPLSSAEFTVYAAEDFIVGGEVVHAKDDVICVLTTDENGYASNLLDAESVEVGEQTYYPMYVGAKYYLKETKAPEGYVLVSEAEYFEFEYMDASIRYSTLTLGEINNIQQGSLTIYKTDGETQVALEGAEFDIIVAEDFIVGGVTILTKGDVVTSVVTGADGKANTGNVLYVGAKYYLVETKAPEGYVLDETQIPFEVGYNVDVEYSEVQLSVVNSEDTTTGTGTPEVPEEPSTPDTDISIDTSPETGVYNDTTILFTLGVFLAAVNVVIFARKRKTN